MNIGRALASALHIFAAFSFFVTALFFLSLPSLPAVRCQIADILLRSPSVCTQIGIGFLLSALALFFGFFGIHRGRFLRIQIGGRRVSVDRDVIYKTVEECFRRQFSQGVSLSQVEVIRGHKLEIEVSLLPFEEGEREELFVQIQRHLPPLLAERFGYARPFHLVVKSYTARR